MMQKVLDILIKRPKWKGAYIKKENFCFENEAFTCVKAKITNC